MKSLLCIVLAGLLSIEVFGYDGSKKPSVDDITTWSQDDRIWKENSEEYLNLEDPESTIEEAGCSLFSLTYMLYKAGYLKDNETHLSVLSKVRELDLWDARAKDFHIDWNRISELEKDFSVAEEFDEELVEYSLKDKTNKECLAILKYLYNKGYFIIVCFNVDDLGSHYVFLDSFTDSDNFSLMDSLRPVMSYKESIYDIEGAFNYIVVFSNDKVKNNELNSLYGGKKLETVELSDWELKYLDYLESGVGREKKWLTREDFVY